MRFPKDLRTADRIAFADRTLVFLIDDTGDETRRDDRQPFFGMGGCGVLGRDMDALVNRPWREVRHAITGSPDTPLHAAEMRPPFESAHLAALSSFFSQNAFMRFGVSCDRNAEFPPSLELTAVMLAALQIRLNDVLQWSWATDVAVIFEHSERLEAAIKRGFDAFSPQQFGRVLEWTPCFLPKWANEPAMEVADFIAHAVGGQARHVHTHGYGRNHRRDFQSVFHSVERTLTSYLHIREVRVPKESREGLTD